MTLNWKPTATTSLQIIFWWHPDDYLDHWAFKFWRWPTGETLQSCINAGWKDFGFRALTIGPLEFRWWPRVTPPIQ